MTYWETIKAFFKTPKPSNRLSFLDGYRGFLALLVIVDHFCVRAKLLTTNFKYVFGFGSLIGVPGFFILSSFLLTYRLLIDFDRAENSHKVIILKIIQYAIRRFFRIYLTFIIFLITENIILHTDFKFCDNKCMGSINNHLWTIPTELKFYFFIPIISYMAIKFGKYWYTCVSLLTLMSLSIVLYVFIYNKIVYDFIFAYYEYLYPSLPTFISGSILAILYYNTHSYIKDISKKNRIFLNCLLIILTISQFIYCSNISITTLIADRLYPSVVFVFMCMLLMLFSGDSQVSIMTTYVYNNSFLCSCGTFSFGIYLFHILILEVFLHYWKNFNINAVFLVFVILCSYLVGFIWFYLVENNLMNIANCICDKLSKMKIFQKDALTECEISLLVINESDDNNVDSSNLLNSHSTSLVN